MNGFTFTYKCLYEGHGIPKWLAILLTVPCALGGYPQMVNEIVKSMDE